MAVLKCHSPTAKIDGHKTSVSATSLTKEYISSEKKNIYEKYYTNELNQIKVLEMLTPGQVCIKISECSWKE